MINSVQTPPITTVVLAPLVHLQRVGSLIVTSIGAFVLFSWLQQLGWLQTLGTGPFPMQPNTALAFVLAGLALGLQTEPVPALHRRTAQTAAGAIVLLSLLTLSQYLFGWHLGIDELLLNEEAPAIGLTITNQYPGRMAVNTACCFLLTGCALLWLDLCTPWGRPAEWCTLCTGFITMTALIGYIYGVNQFIGPFTIMGMALSTVFTFAILCWGILAARPRVGVMRHFWSSGPPGIVARSMALGGTLSLLLLSYLTHRGQIVGYYDAAVEASLLLSLGIVIFSLLVYQSMGALVRLETDRQASFVAFQEQYTLLQGIINSTHDGIYVCDLTGRYQLVNQAGAAAVGFTPAEMVGKSFHELFTPAIAAQVAAEDQTVIQTGQVQVQELKNRSPHAVTIWHSVKTPYRDFAGKTVGVLSVVRDITERKAAEEKLHASQREQAELLALLTALLDNAPIGFAFFDRDLRFVQVNQQLAELNGLPIADHVGRPLTAVLPVLGPILAPFIKQVFDTGQGIYQQMMSGANPANPTVMRHVLSSWYPVRVDESGVRFVGAAIVDITDLERAKAELHALNHTLEQRVAERTAELERSNRELDRFAYVASHDLKSPLRAIVNLSTWMAEDAGDHLPLPSREHLAKLRGRALRMERLLDDLLAYSRIGRRTAHVEEVATAKLVQDAVALLAPPTGFRVLLMNSMPILRTPHAPLALVFRNLIGNALKHHPHPETGEVQISAQRQDAFICFCVRDNGAGIDPRFHKRIFELYQTLQPRDEVEGSGMGLAFVKKTVEHYGGQIWVESAVGQGAAFNFTWPSVPNQS